MSTFVTRKHPRVLDVIDGILTDNGGEFQAEEMREVANILNIRVHTTAAESPFQMVCANKIML